MNTKANCDPTIAVKKPAAPSVSRRDAVNLIVGGAAGVSGLALGDSASANTDDPIFALIEAHRRSLLERNNAFDAATSGEDEDATDPLFERETKDLEALMRTEPTIIAGVCAMVSYLADYAKEYQLPDGPEYPEDGPAHLIANGCATELLTTLSRALDKIGRGAING